MKIKRAEFEARKVIHKYEFEKVPIDLQVLIDKLNITMVKDSFEKFGALLYKKNDKLLMIVNEENPPDQQRFHIAHEIGHYILGHEGTFFQSIAVVSNKPNKKSLEEQCADAFASELLVPSCILRRVALKLHFDVKKLKRVFKVSEFAMAYKLYRLELPYKNTYYDFEKNFYS